MAHTAEEEAVGPLAMTMVYVWHVDKKGANRISMAAHELSWTAEEQHINF